MRALVVLLLLLLVPLGASASPRLPIELADCEYAAAFLRVPPQQVAPYVPSGLQVLRELGAWAVINVGALDCDPAESATETRPASFGWLSVNVYRPTDPWLRGSERMENGGLYFYAFETFTDDDAVGHLARAVGFATLEGAIDAGSATTGSSFSLESGAVAYAASVAPSPGMDGTGAASYAWRVITKDAGGFAAFEGTLDRDAASAGTLVGLATLAEGSMGATLVGAQAMAGLMSYGPDYRVEDAFFEHR